MRTCEYKLRSNKEQTKEWDIRTLKRNLYRINFSYGHLMSIFTYYREFDSRLYRHFIEFKTSINTKEEEIIDIINLSFNKLNDRRIFKNYKLVGTDNHILFGNKKLKCNKCENNVIYHSSKDFYFYCKKCYRIKQLKE